MFNDDDLVKAHRGRAEAIGNIILISFAIILARLWFLQVYKGEMFARYSLQNRLRKESIKAPRGMVFDRDNRLLIHNSPRFDITLTPQYLRNKKETIKKLSEIIKIPIKDIEKILKRKRGQAKYMPVTIKKNANATEVAIIETEHYKLPGITVKLFISREYNEKEIGAHLLGYVSEISKEKLIPYRKRDKINYQRGDYIGVAGIEKMLDLDLRGRDGHEFVEVDARGRMKRYVGGVNNLIDGIENLDAVPGKNIRLTVDADLQRVAYKALEEKTGSAVAVDIHSGEVLAMVSRPSFDPSKFSKQITADYWKTIISNTLNPLRDRVIQEHYPPASTFKTITAIAALEEGIIDANTEVHCSGKFRLGRRIMHCWKRHGHKKVKVIKALRESCDVFFYKIATKMDIDVLANYAKMLGFGSKTGINLPREIGGLIPTKEWKLKRNGEPWQKGETLSCVIGQSYVLATPLQLVMAYSVIANGGKLYRPYIIKEIFNNGGKVDKKYSPAVVSNIKISESTLKLVREGLFQAVNKRKGTAWWRRGRGINMSGKTGTGQVVRFSADKIFNKCEELEYKYRNHGVFVGYAPSDDPQIAVAVLVEHGCHGSSAAAPVARDIITAYMKKYMPEKHQEILAKEKREYLKKLREEKKKQKEGENKVGSV